MAKNNESCVRYSVFCVKIQYCDSISKFMVTCSRQLCSVLTVETDGEFVVALYSINPIFFWFEILQKLKEKTLLMYKFQAYLFDHCTSD